MTLIVASHTDDGTIVICGDSLITGNDSLRGRVKLLNGFRKIKNIGINILFPELDLAGKITRYDDMQLGRSCMIAFAGSTLVAQHIINNIEGHFKRVLFTFKDGSYKLIMECEGNHDALSDFWSDDMFTQTPSRVVEYLDRDFQINLIAHAINNSIDSFISENNRYDSSFFDTQFIVALSCYKTNNNHLFEIKMDFSKQKPFLVVREIFKDDMASIGISQYNESIKEFLSDGSDDSLIEKKMLKGLCNAIDDSESILLNEIGYPIVLKKFDHFCELRDLQERYRKNPFK